jgi:hypothetical protein
MAYGIFMVCKYPILEHIGTLPKGFPALVPKQLGPTFVPMPSAKKRKWVMGKWGFEWRC